jgi:hypothetical protein
MMGPTSSTAGLATTAAASNATTIAKDLILVVGGDHGKRKKLREESIAVVCKIWWR